MASLFQMAHLTGSMLVLWRDGPQFDRPVWRWISTAFVVICVFASLAIAGKRQWQHTVTAVCLAVGVCLSLAALAPQSAGLRTANPHLVDEVGLNAPFSVFEGMVLSAAPAAILALRIGRLGLSRGRVVWAGLWGVWFPLLASVALSVSQRCAERGCTGSRPCQSSSRTPSFGCTVRPTDSRLYSGLSP